MPRASLPLVRRARADRDIEEAIDHYLDESPATAIGFVDDIERAFARIHRAPASGSPRWAHELNLPGLRSWPCARYPYLIFYRVTEERIDIWRVLHTKRDIPAWLSAED